MMLKAEKGFTLIELLIVVAIIGILAGIAVPNLSRSAETAKEGACLATLNAIESAAELYQFEKNSYPSINDLVEEHYLKEAPKCPSGGALAIDKTSGVVSCSKHKPASGS